MLLRGGAVLGAVPPLGTTLLGGRPSNRGRARIERLRRDPRRRMDWPDLHPVCVLGAGERAGRSGAKRARRSPMCSRRASGTPPWRTWRSARHPELLRGLTFGVLGLEALCPLALLLPWRHGVLRTVTLLLLCAMHAGIGTIAGHRAVSADQRRHAAGAVPAGRLGIRRPPAARPGAGPRGSRRRALDATAAGNRGSDPLPQTAPPSRFARRTVAAVCATAFALVLACNIQSVWALADAAPGVGAAGLCCD